MACDIIVIHIQYHETFEEMSNIFDRMLPYDEDDLKVHSYFKIYIRGMFLKKMWCHISGGYCKIYVISIGFTKWVVHANWPPLPVSKADISSVSPPSEQMRKDQRLKCQLLNLAALESWPIYINLTTQLINLIILKSPSNRNKNQLHVTSLCLLPHFCFINPLRIVTD